MNLKISQEDFNRSPFKESLADKQDIIFLVKDHKYIIFKVSDDFVRDLNILLNSWENQTNYTTILINLIFKADNYNWKKLHKIYPAETFTIWCYKNVLGFAEQLKI